jgi:phage I-like protein
MAFATQICSMEIKLVNAAAPEMIEIIPQGSTLTGRDGRSWLNDRPGDVIKAFKDNKAFIPIDCEHSSEHKAPKGEPAPAFGWVENLFLNPQGAMWGSVRWTPSGKTMVENREYRYISPVFLYQTETRRIARIVSVGLTNRPNLFLQALCTEQRHSSIENINQFSGVEGKMVSALNQSEQRICELMGVNPEDFMKTKQDELAEALNHRTPTTHEEAERAEVERIYRLCGVTREDVEKYGSK